MPQLLDMGVVLTRIHLLHIIRSVASIGHGSVSARQTPGRKGRAGYLEKHAPINMDTIGVLVPQTLLRRIRIL
jgi:hypothetical protein